MCRFLTVRKRIGTKHKKLLVNLRFLAFSNHHKMCKDACFKLHLPICVHINEKIKKKYDSHISFLYFSHHLFPHNQTISIFHFPSISYFSSFIFYHKVLDDTSM